MEKEPNMFEKIEIMRKQDLEKERSKQGAAKGYKTRPSSDLSIADAARNEARLLRTLPDGDRD